MNTFKIFKLKFYYLFNKNTIIVFIANFFFLALCLIMEAFNLDVKESNENLQIEYLINAYLYIKLFVTFICIYLFSYSITFKNDFLIYLLIPLGVKREKSLVVTILLNVIIILFFYILIFIVFAYLGRKIDNFFISFDMISAFFCILLSAYIYGLYAMLAMQIIQNNFSMIMILGIFIFSNNMVEDKNNDFLKFLCLAIPAVDDTGMFLYNDFYLLILLFLVVCLNLVIYHYRDLNF